MLSRVADAVYWTARYLERAENTARLIDVNLHLSLDAPIAFSDQWQPLVAVTGDFASFVERYGEASRENVVQFLAFDSENPNSIVSCLKSARENARTVRDVVSSDVWEQINRLYLTVTSGHLERSALAELSTFVGDLKLQCNLIAGLADNTMSHGPAWHFFQLGRLMERADNTSRMVDVKYFLLLPSIEDVGGAVDELQWSVLLRSASALEMYRKRHGPIEPEKVIDFLLLDVEFPRALLFCLMRAEESLKAISAGRGGANVAERQLGRLRSELAYSHVYDIITTGLHEFLDGMEGKLNAVGEAIADTFFGLQRPRPAGEAKRGARIDVLPGDQGQRWAGGNRGHKSDLGQ